MTSTELNVLFDAFVAANNNKQVEAYDATSPFQCFDLIIAWCDKLGVPRLSNGSSIFPFWGASQIYTDYQSMQAKWFDKVANTADYIPKKGDILVWRADYPGTGGAGHTAIATGKGTLSTFEAFTQNNPKYRLSVVSSFPYTYVLGALRYKVTSSGTAPTPPNNMETKKAVQVDKIASWFKEQGYATDAGTEQYFNNPADPDKFFNKVKAVIAQVKQTDPNAQAKIQAAKDEGIRQGTEDKRVKDKQIIQDALNKI